MSGCESRFECGPVCESACHKTACVACRKLNEMHYQARAEVVRFYFRSVEEAMMKFDFTEEEVQLNKKEILSERQKQVLHAMAYSIRSSSISGLWLMLFFLALGTCITGAVTLSARDSRNFQIVGLQTLAGLCFTVVAGLTIYSLSIFFSYRRAAKIEAAPVLSAEGVISHGSDYSSNYGLRSYYVYFGKTRFSFPDKMNRTFPAGSTFRIYYCKVGQIELIMSFERLT